MGYLETLVATMAAGIIPSDDEFALAGISKEQAMQLKGEESVLGVRKSRSGKTKRPPTTTPPRTTTPPATSKTPTAEDVLP